jgi:hypothetical protein
MSKTAEDILKEMDAVTKLADDLDAVVEASAVAEQAAKAAAAKPVTAPPTAVAAKPAVAEPVVPGLKMPLSELLRPAYKPDGFSMSSAAPANAEAPARIEPRSVEARVEPPAPAVAPVAATQRPELTSGNRPGVSVLPATGKILENLSGSLDLLLIGTHASIQRAGIQEQDEQLGILSMVVANLKKVQNQVDGILGRI